jgi:hypothetical protein
MADYVNLKNLVETAREVQLPEKTETKSSDAFGYEIFTPTDDGITGGWNGRILDDTQIAKGVGVQLRTKISKNITDTKTDYPL